MTTQEQIDKLKSLATTLTSMTNQQSQAVSDLMAAVNELTAVTAPTPPTLIIESRGTGVRTRTGPGTTYSITGSLNYGEKVTALDGPAAQAALSKSITQRNAENLWLNTDRGWVASWWLQFATDSPKVNTLVGAHGAPDPDPNVYLATGSLVPDALHLMKMSTIKVLVPGSNSAVVNYLRNHGIQDIKARLFWKFDQPISAQAWVNYMLPYVLDLYAAGVRYFEVANEVNLSYPEGLHVMWSNGYQHADWHISVVSLFRNDPRLRDAKWGYPALSPGPHVPQPNNPNILLRYDSDLWWQQGKAAIDFSDWVGVHTYWGNANRVWQDSYNDVHRWVNGPLRGKEVLITEYSNPATHETWTAKAQQIVSFINQIKSTLPINSMYLYIISPWGGWPYENVLNNRNAMETIGTHA